MSKPQGSSVKQRSETALKDEFLIDAVKFTTEKLKNGKLAATAEHGNWEEWRERGKLIRAHTIAHLDFYLNQFIENARAQGVHVHFAPEAKDAARIAVEIAKHHQAKSVVKSKSMVSEEVHINEAFEELGIESVESDLGEYIIQLANEPPSHIIIPAIHKNRYQIAELLSKEAGQTLPPETKVLAGFARQKLRDKFLEADIGLTGCNFGIAESGSVVIFENEGNARMVSTVPKTQITLMGMERLIPTWDDLEVMATLLPRSATGQKLTVYMSGITGPRRQSDGDGPEEMHIIIVDNGRSLQLGDPDFQELLNCIRCGACLNACPVYRHIGGHSYPGTYSGPIGAVLTPALNKNSGEWEDVANASSLCGACYEACPVKIPLHDMLVYLRNRKVEDGHTATGEKMAMKGFKVLMSSYKLYSKAVKMGQVGQKLLVRNGVIKSQLGPLKGWTAYRHIPALPTRSFREQWKALSTEVEASMPSMSSETKTRLEQMVLNRKKGGHE